jgi:hypothetical protein
MSLLLQSQVLVASNIKLTGDPSVIVSAHHLEL